MENRLFDFALSLLLRKMNRNEVVEKRENSQTSVDYLKRACRDASASVEVGHDTTRQLQKQGEQMEGISRTLDSVEYELRVSDRIVKSMSSWGGMVASWFTSAPKRPKDKQPNEKPTSKGDVPSSARDNENAKKKGDTRSVPVLRDPVLRDEVRTAKAEEDALLDTLANDLDTLKHQATNQREVLAVQNRQLDALNAKSERVKTHMDSTNRKVRKML